jgi:hypothetical protein
VKQVTAKQERIMKTIEINGMLYKQQGDRIVRVQFTQSVLGNPVVRETVLRKGTSEYAKAKYFFR